MPALYLVNPLSVNIFAAIKGVFYYLKDLVHKKRVITYNCNVEKNMPKLNQLNLILPMIAHFKIEIKVKY